MIAKVIRRKKKDGCAARFKDTALYITKGESHEKVSAVAYNGFISEETALSEMVALGSLGGGDPTYHFVLSWQEGEIPTKEQAFEAGRFAIQALVDVHNKRVAEKPSEKMMDASFMQSIMAVHRDTKNIHLHVLLNRRDPETRTLLNTRRDYLTLDWACRKIECKQGWRHSPGPYQVDPANKDEIIRSKKLQRAKGDLLSEVARRIEEHTGLESFETRARGVASDILKAAQSWEALHENLKAQGLEFKKTQKGAVLTDGETYVKASHCGSDCSMSSLQRRLGEFREMSESAGSLRLQRKVERALLRNKLWDEYREYKNAAYKAWMVEKKQAYDRQRQSEHLRKNELQSAAKRRREGIYSQGWKGKGAVLKAFLSVCASQAVQERLMLQQQFDAERAKLQRNYAEKPFKSWRDFCRTRAGEGDLAAQKALRGFRYRDRRKKTSENQMIPEEETIIENVSYRPLDLKEFFCFIHGDGQVDYFDKTTQILSFSDHGRSIHVFDSRNEKALEAALRIAIEKWGRVELKGDAEFQKKVRDIAVHIRAEKYVKASPQLQIQDRSHLPNPASALPQNVRDSQRQDAPSETRRRLHG